MTEEEARRLVKVLSFCDCGRQYCEDQNDLLLKAIEICEKIDSNRTNNRFTKIIEEDSNE